MALYPPMLFQKFKDTFNLIVPTLDSHSLDLNYYWKYKIETNTGRHTSSLHSLSIIRSNVYIVSP